MYYLPPRLLSPPRLAQEGLQMFRFRHAVASLACALILSAFVSVGCDYKGEEPVAEKDFAVSSTVKTAIGAAGSTFVAPIMSNWITAYEQSHPSVLVNYRPIGSGAGLNELSKNLLGLAASDAPLNDDQISKMFPVVQVPVSEGPVCAIYNLPDVTSPLRLSGSTLAGIFLGSIFSSYLAKVNPEWAQKAGQGLSVKWPVGIGEEGSKAVLEFVKKNPGTIGYAELNYAKENKLPVASVQNRAGSFVAPTSASATAAIEAFSDALAKDARTPIVDPPASAKDAYPMSGLTFLLVPKDGADADERRAIRDFITYAVTTGQDSAESLDYAKLPKTLQQQDLSLLAGLTVGGQPLK